MASGKYHEISAILIGLQALLNPAKNQVEWHLVQSLIGVCNELEADLTHLEQRMTRMEVSAIPHK